MNVSVSTPKPGSEPNKFLNPYSDSEYDSQGEGSYEKEDYFNPQNDNEMLWHKEN